MAQLTHFETTRKRYRVSSEQFLSREEKRANLNDLIQQRKRDTTLRETEKLRTMIADLEQIVTVLEASLTSELERSRVKDPSDYAFPMSARALIARRDNLKTTITSLLDRLARLKATFVDETRKGEASRQAL
jgi:hypothetical protein